MNHVGSSLSKQQIEAINNLLDIVSERQRKDFGNINSYLKSDGSLITECDKWSDKTIVNHLSDITVKEGVLSEEGSKLVPETSNYWVVDPLYGTTNFSTGIPFWAISLARFTNGKPQIAFLDIPPLKKRIFAVKGKGVWLNGNEIKKEDKDANQSSIVSLCSRSIRVLQNKPNKPFPGKIRLLGVASLNMASVAIGQTIGALEATPKIWDLAAAWLVLSELGCSIKWLDKDPANLICGNDLSDISFPVLIARSEDELLRLMPWGEALRC